jgi:hypothetical protein
MLTLSDQHKHMGNVVHRSSGVFVGTNFDDTKTTNFPASPSTTQDRYLFLAI